MAFLGFILGYLVTVVLPAILWFRHFRSRDTSQPEPLPFLKKVFRGGFLAVLLALLIETPLQLLFGQGDNLIAPTSLIGWLIALVAVVAEELLKLYFLYKRAYFNFDFDQIADGFIYGATLGLGFATLENTFYFVTFLATITPGQTIFLSLIRSLATSLMHATTTGLVGYYLAKKKFSPGHPRALIYTGAAIAIVIHFCFNSLLGLPGGFIISLAVTFISFSLCLKLIATPYAKIIWKYVPNPTSTQ